MNYKYDLIDEELSKKNSNTDQDNPTQKLSIFSQVVGNIVLSIVVIILSICLYMSRSQPDCIEKWSTYSPLRPLVQTEPRTVKFNGTFSHPSPYKGPPNADVDKAWDDLYSYIGNNHAKLTEFIDGSFRILPEDLKRINGSPNAAKWAPEVGGGYIGFLEVLHQIHCVHFLWQHLYEDYYETHTSGRGFVDPKPVRLEHANHCADLLRQKLMCDADVGLIQMFWVKHHDHPWPDFNTVHKCRNFDAVLEWVIENQVDLPDGVNMTRTEDTIDLETPP